MSLRVLLVTTLLFTAFACSDDDQQPKPDATIDAIVVDTTVDVSPRPDAGVDTANIDASVDDLGPDASNFSECAGACAAQTLAGDFGATHFSLEVAYYGIDRDEANNAGVYLEAYHNADDGCPADGSKTPDQTLIISGLPLPSQGGVITKDDGLVLSLLDFSGDVLAGGLLTKATSAEVRFVAAHTCPSCVGMTSPSHPEGFVALELTAIFPEGTLNGHIYAKHCDSLDL